MFDKNKFHESSQLTLDSMYEDHRIEGICSWVFENGVIVHFSIGDEKLFSICHIDNNEDLMKECLEFINLNQGKVKVPLFWLLKNEYGNPMGVYECHINKNQESPSKKSLSATTLTEKADMVELLKKLNIDYDISKIEKLISFID